MGTRLESHHDARPRKRAVPSDRAGRLSSVEKTATALKEPTGEVVIVFHRVRTVRIAGAATKMMPMHRQGVATNQAGRSNATGGGPELAARGVEDLVRSFGYALRPSSGGSTHLKAMKCYENLTGRLSGDRCTPVPTQRMPRGVHGRNTHPRRAMTAVPHPTTHIKGTAVVVALHSFQSPELLQAAPGVSLRLRPADSTR